MAATTVTLLSRETMKTTKRSRVYRVLEITTVLERITEQLSALHDNIHQRRLSLLPSPPKSVEKLLPSRFDEKILSPKPIERFGQLHAAAQHFDQALFTLQEHPLGKAQSIWLVKLNCTYVEELDELEELDASVMDILRKCVILLEDCNVAIVRDLTWMNNRLRGAPDNENEADTARVLKQGQQKELASEINRKTYALRNIVSRLVAMNAGASTDAYGPVPGRTERASPENVCAIFDDSTKKFSKLLVEATTSSTKQLIWRSSAGNKRLWSKKSLL